MSHPVRTAAALATISRLWYAVPMGVVLAMSMLALALPPETAQPPDARQEAVTPVAPPDAPGTDFLGA